MMILLRYILLMWLIITIATYTYWEVPESNVILRLAGAFGTALPFALVPLIWSRLKPVEERQNILTDYMVPTVIMAALWLLITLGRMM